MPALLTSISNRPNEASVFSIISRIDAGFDISAGECNTRTLNSDAIWACASAILSGVPKPLRTISDPAAASARAMPRPIPLVDPVTSETRPQSARAAAMLSDLMATFMIGAPERIARFQRGPKSMSDALSQHQCQLATHSIEPRYEGCEAGTTRILPMMGAKLGID